jgi:hypothetical protein
LLHALFLRGHLEELFAMTPSAPRWSTKGIVLVLSQALLAACANRWVDIWGTMPQLVEPANLPPTPFVGFSILPRFMSKKNL